MKTVKNSLNTNINVDGNTQISIIKVREILGEKAGNLTDEQLDELLCKMRSMVSILRDYHECVH